MIRSVKRFLGALTAAAMLLSLLPAQALAAQTDQTGLTDLTGEYADPSREAVTERPVQAELLPAEPEEDPAGETAEPSPEPGGEEPEPPEEIPGTPENPAEPGPEGAPEGEAELLAGLDQVTGDGFQYRVENGGAAVTKYIGNAQNVVIPETLGGAPVTAIGADAFNGYTAMIDLKLPAGLTALGARAFSGCTSLQSVVIPAGITSWGDHTFQRCTNLQSVVLPDGLTTIGQGAFADCTALDDISIPSTLGTFAASEMNSTSPFAGCTNLRSASLRDGMTTVPGFLFQDCPGLQEVRLPDTVTYIDKHAFRLCKKLVTINLPSQLRTIGKKAFDGCASLAAIDLPEGLAEIQENAFWNCDALTSVRIPASVVNWGGGGTFMSCDRLSSIELPEGLTTLAASAFKECRSLTSVTIPSTLQSVTYRYGPFESCYNLREVRFGQGIPAIPAYLFMGCKGLSAITLPESVTSIGAYAFCGCDNLIRVSLPSGLKRIENNAFDACKKLASIDLREGLSFIGNYAFWHCESLESVRVPASIESLAQNVFSDCYQLTAAVLPEGLASVWGYAFSGCRSLKSLLVEGRSTVFRDRALNGIGSQATIYAPLRSEATISAIEYQIPFRSTDAASRDSALYALDYGKTRLYADLNGMSANGCVTLTVDYALKRSSTAVPSVLQIRLPNNVELIQDSVTLNGSGCTGFSQDRNNRYLWYFPVTEASGALRLRVRLTAPGNLLGYARLEMKQGNTTVREVAGVLSEQIQPLTMNLPEVTSQSRISLSGVAPASAAVELSVDGQAVQTVTASKAGIWSAKLTLPNPQENTSCAVSASCPNGNQTLTCLGSVCYQKDAPTLTGLELTYNMHGETLRADLMGGDLSVKPRVFFMPRTEFRFDVTFENPEQLKTVYVTSTRGGEKKYLEAEYVPSLGRFVAQGFFDPDNLNYVPGQIRVEYTPRTPKVNYTQEDLKELVPKTGLTTDSLTNVTFNENTKTTTAQVDVGPLIEGIDKLVFDTTVSVFDETMGTDLDSFLSGADEVLSLVRFLDGNNKEMEAQICSMEGGEAYVTIIHNVTDSTYTKWVLREIEASTGGGQVTGTDIFDIADGISKTSMVSGIIANEYKLNREVEDLRAEILSNTSLNDAQRAEAEKRLKGYAHDKSVFQMATTLLPLVVAAAGAAGGGAALLVFSGILGMMTATSSFFWDYRVGQIQGDACSVDWVVDPSGYVYDQETGARLEGVTATAYYIPVESDTELTEAHKPANTVYGTVWNASEYNQANPLTTDVDGRYAWDVPQGWWRVKYEKTGYETAWSDWLPVPPPQTEVNIGMKPLVSSRCTAELTGWTASAADIRVTNRTEEAVSLLFAAAAYRNGQMILCRTAQWDLAAGGTASLSLPVTGEDGTVLRCFFLSPDTGKPLTRSFRDYWRQ